jgi:hypothetical protein
MATQIKSRARSLYQEDPYRWAQVQAALLRDRRFADLDLANLVEEIDDLAGAIRRSVRSHTRRIIEHLLKLQHSPAPEPRLGWRATVRDQRSELLDRLTPSLRRELEADLGRALRPWAAADALPEACPYGLTQIEGDWLP